MDKLTEAFVSIIGLVVGVAILSVIVSKNSNTGAVIQNLFSGVGNLLSVATGPVTGQTTAPNLAYAAGGALDSLNFGSGFNITG